MALYKQVQMPTGPDMKRETVYSRRFTFFQQTNLHIQGCYQKTKLRMFEGGSTRKPIFQMPGAFEASMKQGLAYSFLN